MITTGSWPVSTVLWSASWCSWSWDRSAIVILHDITTSDNVNTVLILPAYVSKSYNEALGQFLRMPLLVSARVSPCILIQNQDTVLKWDHLFITYMIFSKGQIGMLGACYVRSHATSPLCKNGFAQLQGYGVLPPWNKPCLCWKEDKLKMKWNLGYWCNLLNFPRKNRYSWHEGFAWSPILWGAQLCRPAVQRKGHVQCSCVSSGTTSSHDQQIHCITIRLTTPCNNTIKPWHFIQSGHFRWRK